jgi:hypothetical protein
MPRGGWVVSFVCGLLFLIWITDAGILYGFMVGREPIGFLRLLRIEQVVLDYAGYSAIMGGVLAFILFAVSAFSIPLIYDGRATLVPGVVASVRAVFGRFGVMMCWAFLLAVVIMGSVMALPLLLVSLPVMAYASRELYFRVLSPCRARDMTGLLRAPRLEQRVARDAAPAQDAAQLAERLELDLAHALAGQFEPLGEFFQREQLALVDAIAVTDHHALLVVEDREPFAHELLDLGALDLQVGGHLLLVGERLADRKRRVDIERRIERGGVLAEREDDCAPLRSSCPAGWRSARARTRRCSRPRCGAARAAPG